MNKCRVGVGVEVNAPINAHLGRGQRSAGGSHRQRGGRSTRRVLEHGAAAVGADVFGPMLPFTENQLVVMVRAWWIVWTIGRALAIHPV